MRPRAQSLPARRSRRPLLRIRRWRRQGRTRRVQRALGRLLPRFRQAPEVWYELARSQEQLQPERALQLYRRVLWLQSQHEAALYRMGKTAFQLGHFQTAVTALEAYLACQPHAPARQVYYFLGESFKQLQQLQRSQHYFLLALESGYVDLNVCLGLFSDADTPEEIAQAIEWLQRLALLYPMPRDRLAFLLGFLYEKKYDIPAAVACYDAALQFNPHQTLLRLKRALTYPVIVQDLDDFQRWAAGVPQALSQTLNQLRQQPLRLKNQGFTVLNSIYSGLFRLIYANGLPLAWRQQFAQLLTTLIEPAGLAASAVQLQRAPQSSRPLHLGIIMASRSIWMSYIYVLAMVDLLDPEVFQVSLFCFGERVHELLDQDRPHHVRNLATRAYVLQGDLEDHLTQLRQARLDIAWFTEPNWDFKQYFLAACRVAPAQCTSVMNASSTGLPTMDYFLSVADFHPTVDQQDYSEQLILWDALPCWMPQIVFPEPVPRSEFGLDPAAHLYTCLQNPRKFHPDFDALLAGILKADPQGQLLLVADVDAVLAQQLTQRFERVMPELMPRIWVFPALPNVQFLQLLQLSDVVLDTLYYGGGTTTYQTLAWGAPLVTLPTPGLTGQATAALCRRVDYTEGIVASPEAYIQKAVALAADPAARRAIQQRLRRTAQRLFEPPDIKEKLHRSLEQMLP